MKCFSRLYNKEGSNPVIVRRKFVPIRFQITRENQYVNATAKLPFTFNTLIGLLTTSKAEPCNETSYPPTYYFGISDTEMVDDQFLNTDSGNTYDSPYPPDIRIESTEGKWWYFVHPLLDRNPYQLGPQGFRPLENPKQLEIHHQGQCLPEYYALWSRPVSASGTIFLSFFPES